MNLNLSTKLVINKDVWTAPNLVDRFSEEDRTKIGRLCWEGYERDKQSRAAWERRTQAAMDLALQIQKDKNFPWQGCSNVIFPLITVAALQFSARSYSNIIQGTDVVRYRVVGEDPDGRLLERAERIGRHMSWQVLEQDQSWEEQHDRLLLNLGIVGTNFIKTFFSPRLGHNVSELVMAQDLVMDYYAKSVETCGRKTQIIPLYRNEIYERCMRDLFDRDILNESWYTSSPQLILPTNPADNRKGQTPPPSDQDTPFTTLEQHRYLDLDGDGYAEPYVATIEYGSRRLLRLVTRFDSEDAIEFTRDKKIIQIKPTEYFTKYSFIPSPDGGIYDIGFGVLLGPLNESVNTGINQLLDSGTMQNSIGGFLGRGAKIRGGQYTMAPWEWKRVDSTGDDLRKNMVPFPERQPSMVVYQLLSLLINYTERITGTTDPMVGENPGQNTPAETSRNMIEQGMQVYNVIFKRVWRSMKEEFKKLHQLNGEFLKTTEQFGTQAMTIRREDYKGDADLVAPVADPNIVSPSQRMQLAMAVRQASMERPGYDLDAVERYYLRALRVDGLDMLYKGVKKVPPPTDPKIQIESGKLQMKAQEMQLDKQKFLMELAEQKRLNSATIAKLEADIIKIMAELNIQRGDIKLRTLDLMIKSMQEQDRILNERIEKLNGGTEDGGSQSAGGNSGRISGMEAASGLEVDDEASPDMGGESEGAMGLGGVPGNGS